MGKEVSRRVGMIDLSLLAHSDIVAAMPQHFTAFLCQNTFLRILLFELRESFADVAAGFSPLHPATKRVLQKGFGKTLTEKVTKRQKIWPKVTKLISVRLSHRKRIRAKRFAGRVRIALLCATCAALSGKRLSFLESQRKRDDNKNKICAFQGGVGRGAERKIVQNAIFSWETSRQ